MERFCLQSLFSRAISYIYTFILADYMTDFSFISFSMAEIYWSFAFYFFNKSDIIPWFGPSCFSSFSFVKLFRSLILFASFPSSPFNSPGEFLTRFYNYFSFLSSFCSFYLFYCFTPSISVSWSLICWLSHWILSSNSLIVCSLRLNFPFTS